MTGLGTKQRCVPADLLGVGWLASVGVCVHAYKGAGQGGVRRTSLGQPMLPLFLGLSSELIRAPATKVAVAQLLGRRPGLDDEKGEFTKLSQTAARACDLTHQRHSCENTRGPPRPPPPTPLFAAGPRVESALRDTSAGKARARIFAP